MKRRKFKYLYIFTSAMIAKHESEPGSYLFSTVLYKDILLFCPAEYEVFYAGGYK